MISKYIFKRILTVILLSLLIFVCFPVSTHAEQGDLGIQDSTVSFSHFDYTLDKNNHIKTVDKEKIVDTQFKTKVIENKYLKVTLLPDFGGRILSIVYKPTNHELLYQNPVGTPYGISEGNFYYDWLMVYGGIFPTFPEPEHGKAWCLPWEYKLLEQSDDKITAEMSFTDNIPTADPRLAGKFNNGETGIKCISTVTVYKDRSYVDLGIKLVNNKNEAVAYEYWTCTTLAPGSEPGKTLSPENSEMVVPIETIKVKNDWWPWMGTVEKPAANKAGLFEYNKLATFANWTDMGIAYASPSLEKDWWGVINHENEEGILRIAENKKYTPGLKFWTWGAKQSYAADPKKYADTKRPYIELWAGNSTEFFMDAEMSAKEEKAWVESYMPTVGLSKITNANKHAAISLDYTVDETSGEISFNADVFTTHPNEQLKAVLELQGSKAYTLGESTFTSDPVKANKITVKKSKGDMEKGSYTYVMKVTSSTGELLAQAETPCNSEGTTEKTAASVGASKTIYYASGIAVAIMAIIVLIIIIRKRRQ